MVRLLQQVRNPLVQLDKAPDNALISVMTSISYGVACNAAAATYMITGSQMKVCQSTASQLQCLQLSESHEWDMSHVSVSFSSRLHRKFAGKQMVKMMRDSFQLFRAPGWTFAHEWNN